ncbi:conserved hypothetical protein [Candidatus Terasakiella magnetica]|nr:conserved hypothetical protein [Candidatus Terasakiella magnetica]
MIMSINRRKFLATSISVVLATHRRDAWGDQLATKTDRMFGIRSDKSIFTDQAKFPSRRLKMSLRNMSGDQFWDMETTKERLYQGYIANGYEHSDDNELGVRADIKILYSGQLIDKILSDPSHLFLSRGIGYEGSAGVTTGESLPSLRNYVSDDSIYVVITEVIFAIRRPPSTARRIVTFEGSPRVEEWEESSSGSFQQVNRVLISNYGGAPNVSRADMAEEIRDRQIRSLISLI